MASPMSWNLKTPSTKNSLVKGLHRSVLGWHCHAFHVSLISYCLEVSTTNQQVYLDPLLLLQILNCLIDLVQLPMAAAFYCNFHAVQTGELPTCREIHIHTKRQVPFSFKHHQPPCPRLPKRRFSDL